MDWLLRIAHLGVSLAWQMAVLIFTERAVWFGSGMLVMTHITTGIILVAPLIDKRRERSYAFGTLVASSLALVTLLLYALQLTSAIIAPDGPAASVARQLAGDMWTTEREIAILAFVFMGLTAALHTGTIVYFAPRLSAGGG